MLKLAAVVILAGGQSTRMGQPKALLTLPHGETLLKYHIDGAADLQVPVLIAEHTQNFLQTLHLDRFEERPVVAVRDYVDEHNLSDLTPKNGGALAGLWGALHYLHSAKSVQNQSFVLVISCDSLITAQQLYHWINAQLDIQSTKRMQPANRNILPSAIYLADLDRHGHIQQDYPLLGLYSLALYKPLSRYLETGQRRVMGFLATIKQQNHVNILPIPTHWRILLNVNTPAEFEQASQLCPLKL